MATLVVIIVRVAGIVLLLTAFMSGCVSTPAELDRLESGMDPYAPYHPCPSDAVWEGQDLCRPNAIPVGIGPRPMTSVCTHEVGVIDTLRIHFDAATARPWVTYDTRATLPVSGVLLIARPSVTALYHWQDGPADGSFALDIEETDLSDAVLRMAVYTDGIDTVSEEIARAPHAQMWSHTPDGAWHVVHRIDVDGPVHLYERTVRMSGEEDSYHSFNTTVADEHIVVRMRYILLTGDFPASSLLGC